MSGNLGTGATTKPRCDAQRAWTDAPRGNVYILYSMAKVADRRAGNTIDNAGTGRRRRPGVYRMSGEGRPEREGIIDTVTVGEAGEGPRMGGMARDVSA